MAFTRKILPACIAGVLLLGAAPAYASGNTNSIRENRAASVSVKDFSDAYDAAAVWTVHHLNTKSATVRSQSQGGGGGLHQSVVSLGMNSILVDMPSAGQAYYDREGAVMPLAELGLKKAQIPGVLKEINAPTNTRSFSLLWNEESMPLLISGPGYRNFEEARGDLSLTMSSIIAFDVQNYLKNMRNASATVTALGEGLKRWNVKGLVGPEKIPANITFSNDTVGRIAELSMRFSLPGGAYQTDYSFWGWETTNPSKDHMTNIVPLSVVGPAAWRVVIGTRMELAARLAMKWVNGTGGGISVSRVQIAMKGYKDKAWDYTPNARGGTYRASQPLGGSTSRGIKIVKKGSRNTMVLTRG